jgi:hypothetical protein
MPSSEASASVPAWRARSRSSRLRTDCLATVTYSEKNVQSAYAGYSDGIVIGGSSGVGSPRKNVSAPSMAAKASPLVTGVTGGINSCSSDDSNEVVTAE